MFFPPLLVSPNMPVLLAAYTTVLLAELAGDKSVYTIGALGLRFRAVPAFFGVTLAFMGKMLAAVLFGTAILQMAGHWTSVLSAAGFFGCALFIWLKEPDKASRYPVDESGWFRTAVISFSSLFFIEWCDTGQIAAAALAAHTQALLSVWIGGTMALITKGALAMTLGAKLGLVVPGRLTRTMASASYCVLGTLSLARLLSP